MNKFASGLTTLLMFAIGLGCLNFAFHGLVTGSLDGARGASFAFASKPIKFLLLEFFWIGLGYILLLGAWRGVFQKESDADDDNDQSNTHAIKQTTSSISTSAIASDNLVKSVSDISSYPQDDSIRIGRNLGVTPKSVAPTPLELYTSRFYAVLVFVLFTSFTISSVFTSIALTNIFGKALVVMMFAPLLLVYIKTMRQCFKNFFWTGPVLVFDQFGISNFRKDGHLIPWTRVDSVRLDSVNSATYLILRFKNSNDVNEHFGKIRWLQSITGHLFYKGFEGRVKLTSLVFTRSVVLRKAQDFLRYSRR